MSKTTRDERRKHVDQMNANFAIEDLTPDREDKALQQRYVDGEVTIQDMLAEAHEFAQAAAKKTS